MSLYSLASFIKPWLLPPGINIFTIFLGILIAINAPRTGKIILLIGVTTLWLLSTPFIAYNMIGLLQDKYPLLTFPLNKNVLSPKNDAIVVLSGGDTMKMEYGNKRTVADSTLHRVDYGAYLHQQTNLPVIVSGGKVLTTHQSDAELMAEVLAKNHRITPLLIEDKSLTTADESKVLAPMLKKSQLKKVYLVTNAWHMPRSVYIFNCFAIDVTPAPMGYYQYGPGYALISFFPNMEALKVSSVALHEFIGLFWYRLYYGGQCLIPKAR